jgi:hypothetical protein
MLLLLLEGKAEWPADAGPDRRGMSLGFVKRNIRVAFPRSA